MISAFSVLNALAVCFVVVCALVILNRRSPYLSRCSVSILLLMSAAVIVRVFLPIEIPFNHIVACPWNFLGPFARLFSTRPDVVGAMVVVWIIGAVVMLGLEARRYHATCVERRSYLVLKDERVQKIAKDLDPKLRVLSTPDVGGPFVVGVVHPTIYLPGDRMSDKAIEYALAHEKQHIQNHDAWIKLGFVFVQAVLWWIIPIHLFRRDLDDFLELRCDTKVMDGLSAEEKLAYMESLTDAARDALEFEAAMSAHRSMEAKDKCSLGRRLAFLETYAEKPRRLRPVSAVVVVAVFLASYLVIFQPGLSPSAEQLQDEPEIYYKEGYDGPGVQDAPYDAFIFKGSDGRYQLFINYEFSRYLTEEEIASGQYQNVHIFEEGSNQ